MKYSKALVVLILIVAFGLILRIYNIRENSLYGDELTIVQDAYSILKTGRDSLGNFLPLTFPMGAGRPAGYVYGSVPFVALFGPTELSARALSILSGIGIIILLYYIGRKLFSTKVGLMAAAIGAVSPWDIALSRGGFEAHFALFLALLGIYLFLEASKKGIFYVFSALAFGLTIHTYPTYKLILPLFLILLLMVDRNYHKYLNIKNRFYVISATIILGILISLSVFQTFTGGSEVRFLDINIFSQNQLQQTLIQKINFERSISNLFSFSKYFHNKPVEYGKVLIENYLQNFSLDFLVIHGDGNPRHNMATMGQLYLVDVFLILVGVVTFWQRRRKEILFLAGWILLAPIPTAILDLPHALRSSFMLPPLLILSSLGLSMLTGDKGRVVLGFVMIIFAVQFIFFIQKLYFLAPNEYSQFWSYPAKLASEIALKEKNNFNSIILSDQIDNVEFAYPVYAKIEPTLVTSQNQQKEEVGEYQFKKFDNVYIGYLPEGEAENFIFNLNGSVLYIGQLPKRDILMDHDIIRGRDNMPAILVIRKI